MQINIVIGMDCSEFLGFSFKNHGWEFGLARSQGCQTQKSSHISMPFKKA